MNGQNPTSARCQLETIKAVAAVEGKEPLELEYSLQEYVDVEAIQRLAAHEEGSWTLSFELPEHEVTVESDGRILVDGVRERIWD